MTSTVSNLCASLIAPLPGYAVIAASGVDAASFLHSQLTHDVTGLGPESARLAGYCTAKGRLLATGVLWHGRPQGATGAATMAASDRASAATAAPAAASADTAAADTAAVDTAAAATAAAASAASATAAPAATAAAPTLYLLVRRDLAEPLLKRLRMFVLRAKATLALTELSIHGVQADAPARHALQQGLGAALGALPWQRTELPSGTWIAAPTSQTAVSRWWWIASAAQVRAAERALGQDLGLPPAEQARWQLGDLAAGLPWIAAATQDLFIPQTVNLDLIDGVSFGKGCYPGQEIVARSHYRGTVKRRMAYGHVAAGTAPADAGADIYDSARPDEPCGRIIDLAGQALLFEAPLDALEGRDLRVAAADGPAITVGPLPYPLVKTP